MFECSNRTNDAAPIPGQATGYRVRAISGDPVYVYFGIVDVSRPYAVGVNGTGAITIEGTPGPTAPTLQQVTNADPDHLDVTPHHRGLVRHRGHRRPHLHRR